MTSAVWSLKNSHTFAVLDNFVSDHYDNQLEDVQQSEGFYDFNGEMITNCRFITATFTIKKACSTFQH